MRKTKHTIKRWCEWEKRNIVHTIEKEAGTGRGNEQWEKESDSTSSIGDEVPTSRVGEEQWNWASKERKSDSTISIGDEALALGAREEQQEWVKRELKGEELGLRVPLG